MKLKYFFTLIVTSVGLFFIACNGDNEYNYGEASSDGQIKSFAIDAVPYTAMDSLTYGALSTTKFSVDNNKKAYSIFNKDSLPVNIDLRTLSVTLEFTTSFEPTLKLLYPKDSIVEWTNKDSVKIVKKDGQYYPRILTIAPNLTERTYNIDFRIHTQDPDSIRWHDMDSLANYKLPQKGESKVLINEEDNQFVAYIKNGSIINYYTSSIQDRPAWSGVQQTNLPASALVKTMVQSDNILAVLDANGSVYTSSVTGGVNWTKAAVSNIKTIVGKLPEIKADSPKNEFLVVYSDQDGKLKYGKTADFEAIEEIKIATRGENNELLSEFPIKDFTTVLHALEDEQALIVTGGMDVNNKLLKKSWRIVNISLADGDKKAEISIIPSMNSSVFPEEDQVETFIYNEKIYAMSTDSLSLYHTSNGDNWTLADKKQNLRSPMDDYTSPSVVVDKTNNIWVFGGVSKKGAYTQQIWRGRLNKLAFKE